MNQTVLVPVFDIIFRTSSEPGHSLIFQPFAARITFLFTANYQVGDLALPVRDTIRCLECNFKHIAYHEEAHTISSAQATFV